VYLLFAYFVFSKLLRFPFCRYVGSYQKKNRLEHKRLDKLVYVSYNRKMANRFQRIRQLGSKENKSNPLILQEFRWENEWVHENDEDNNDENSLWRVVDEAVGATEHLRGRNLPRAAAGAVNRTYTRTRKRIAGPPQFGESDSDEEMQEQGEELAVASTEDLTDGLFELADEMLVSSLI
jgi:hypothetical protein